MSKYYSEYINNQFSVTNQNYPKRSFIYAPKEETSEIYLIREGIINIGFKNPKTATTIIKATLFRGDIFGVLRLFHYESLDNYAEVISPTAKVASMSHADFFQKIKTDEPFNLFVLQTVINRVVQLEKRWALVSSMPIRNRLIAFIVEMSLKYGTSIGLITIIKNPFTHEEIGTIIGASLQNVTIAFNQLQDEKLIHYNHKKVIVRNLEELQKSIFRK